MVEQSQQPAILLTRPKAQSQRFARQLRAAAGFAVHIKIAPLMHPIFIDANREGPPPAGLIFTSEAGVAAYLRLPDRPVAPAWCVGAQTARSAKMAMLETILVATDAADLLQRMVIMHPPGPFLHLRGEDSHGNIAENLTAAGIPTTEAVVYAQRPLPLPPRIIRLFEQGEPMILPLFSARSARLFFDQPLPIPQLTVAALSQAVASAVPAHAAKRIVVASRPDAPAMLQTVISLLREPS